LSFAVLLPAGLTRIGILRSGAHWSYHNSVSEARPSGRAALPLLTRGLLTDSPPGEKRFLVDKAQAVAPRIVAVERALTPGPSHNLGGLVVMNSFFRQAAKGLRAFKHRFEIVDREIDVIRNRLRLETAGSLIHERQN